VRGEQIAVIGDGGWGTTLGILLSGKGYGVKLWGPFREYVEQLKEKRENIKFLPGVKIPREIFISSDIEEVAGQKAGVVVLAVPSQYLRQVLTRLKGLDLKGAVLLSVIKGLENHTLMRPSEVIKDVLGDVETAVLSGPSIAWEVARGMPAAVVVSSAGGEETSRRIQQFFMTERFRVYTGDDAAGVELGGALKNIIAIACGISDGLGFGANTKAALLTRGLVEIKRLAKELGANPDTFNGLSGIGDLVTTCVSEHGRNRWVGEQLAGGKRLDEILKGMEMVAEGIRTTESARDAARKYGIEMPITEQIYAVLFQNKDPLSAVSGLMSRTAKPEVG
jgi:glycerol-3-phosphate dehydrogenase (NAD(P)+)